MVSFQYLVGKLIWIISFHHQKIMDNPAAVYYAMLRAWVRDDPYQPIYPPKRRTLTEYASMTAPNSKRKKQEQQEQMYIPPSTSQPPVQTVDMFELLRTSKDQDSSFKYTNRIIDDSFMKWNRDQATRARRHTEKVAYRRKLASARESLRKRGINV